MRRRQILQAAAASIAAIPLLAGSSTAKAESGKTFVLVHGAWHGGWCWRPLVQELEAKGHRASAPTLTGLGERAHLLSATVDLDTHITDIVDHVATEDLHDIVLVGHSYGGFVIRGVAERLAGSISNIVYLDAFVPKNGQRVADYTPPDQQERMREALANNPLWTIPALKPEIFGVVDAKQAAWVERHLTPQPGRTYLQPLALSARADAIASRIYIACMAPKLDVFDETRARIRADSSWRYAELQQGHDVMVTAPALLAQTLLSLVA
jgi:pimeloyl-ACP methyl ester carboxylesterase